MARVDPSMVAIVMPCLNEQDTLLSTCASLGFGAGAGVESPDDAILMLVDNGSTDNTADIMAEVRRHSPTGRVVITHESERGYVPPRHRGNEVSRQLASRVCLPEDRVLILQVDADTQYSSGYVSAMREYASLAGAGVFVEAAVDHTHEDKLRYQDYFAACQRADDEMEPVFAAEADDVIVDDKACGYWLSDYTRWGGHCREYTDAGEEIHAETTRLYLRAKAYGARRFRGEGAVVFHSARRLSEETLAHVASAGFPREPSWKRRWENTSIGKYAPDEAVVASTRFRTAIDVRQQHAVGLFSILPQHAKRTLGLVSLHDEWTREFLDLLNPRSRGEAVERPGQLIVDVLGLVDSHGSVLVAAARHYIASRASSSMTRNISSR